MDKIAKAFRGNSKGVSAIEVIIALAILGIIAVAFLGGLFTALKATSIVDERSVAQSLAQSQMEYVKSQGYSSDVDWSYALTHDTTDEPVGWPSDWVWVWGEDNPPLSEEYAGYCVHAQEEEIEADLRRITVTVYHNEDCAGDEVFTLEDYKVDR